jgi:hypothetical protein
LLGNFHYRASVCNYARDNPHTEFESGARIINPLLRHPEIQAIMHRRAATAERDAVVLPAHPQTGLLTLESPPISRVILTRAGLQIMRSGKTVRTNRGVRLRNAVPGHYSGTRG